MIAIDQYNTFSLILEMNNALITHWRGLFTLVSRASIAIIDMVSLFLS